MIDYRDTSPLPVLPAQRKRAGRDLDGGVGGDRRFVHDRLSEGRGRGKDEQRRNGRFHHLVASLR